MAPLVHCVRHAQGFHNLDGGNYVLPDPSVTPEGVDQCTSLRDTGDFFDQAKLSLIMASPLCRTLHSASIIFQPALTSGGKCSPSILAVPDAQETSDDPCDIGRDPNELAEIAAERQWPVDMSLVKQGWNVKTLDSRYSPSAHAIEARARDTRVLIRQKVRELVAKGDNDDVQVVIVTHGGYLHFLTNDWEDAELGNGGTGWKNCEARSYHFEHGYHEDDADEDAMLIETSGSRKRRGKEHPMFKREVQPQLFKKAMLAWGSHGLQRPDLMGKT